MGNQESSASVFFKIFLCSFVYVMLASLVFGGQSLAAFGLVYIVFAVIGMVLVALIFSFVLMTCQKMQFGYPLWGAAFGAALGWGSELHNPTQYITTQFVVLLLSSMAVSVVCGVLKLSAKKESIRLGWVCVLSLFLFGSSYLSVDKITIVLGFKLGELDDENILQKLKSNDMQERWDVGYYLASENPNLLAKGMLSNDPEIAQRSVEMANKFKVNNMINILKQYGSMYNISEENWKALLGN